MERTTDIGHGVRIVRDGDNARILKAGFTLWDGKWGELIRVVALMEAQPELRDLAIHKSVLSMEKLFRCGK